MLAITVQPTPKAVVALNQEESHIKKTTVVTAPVSTPVVDTPQVPEQPETAPPTPVEVAATPPAPTPIVGCGDDPNMAFIYSHESGCSTASINASSGACGLGQAEPCSKLPCSLSDWDCQNAYFTAYAVQRYGSTDAAYVFWLANRWW